MVELPLVSCYVVARFYLDLYVSMASEVSTVNITRHVTSTDSG